MPETPLDRLLAQRKHSSPSCSVVCRTLSLPKTLSRLRTSAHLSTRTTSASESAVAWFYRLLRNAVIDSYRRQASTNKALQAWTRELETAAQPSPDLHNEVCACLHGILDGLKPEYSEILRGIDLGEQRLQDFAQRHKLSASNAGVRIHRARAALRKQLLRTCATCSKHGCLNCTCKKRSPSAS